MPITRRRFLKGAGTAAAALAFGRLIRPDWSRAASVAGAAQVPGRPNVLLIMTDDQDRAGLRAMRKLAARPAGSWVNFTRAYCNTALCAPSRATLLTGRYAHQHGVLTNGQSSIDAFDDRDTLATWLAAAGYRVGLIGKYLHWRTDDLGRRPGYATWDTAAGDIDGYTERAIRFIEQAESPFCLWLSYRAPHEGSAPMPRYAGAPVYVPPDSPSFNEADVGDKPEAVRLPLLSNREIQELHEERLKGQRVLLSIDDGVAALVETLSRVGRLRDTLIVFVSDNGFAWGDHRWNYKSLPWEPCHGIPLWLRLPGLAGNLTIDRPVSMVDLTATILDWCGIAPGLPPMGRSLLPLIRGDPCSSWIDPSRDWVYIDGFGGGAPTGYRGIIAGRHKLVEYPTGDRELYDLTADPDELDNAAGSPANAAIEAQLARLLAEMDAPVKGAAACNYLPAVAGG